MNNKLLVEKLKQKGYKICAAESCTGGMFTSSLVGITGASDVIDMGFVTYANDAKIKLLGVSADDIEKYGVVSEIVAGQMAKGAADVSGADIGVGITGIAGPGGSRYKPEGMVCFGFCINGQVITKTMQFGAIDRNEVRKKSCDFATDTLIELLK